MKAERNLRRCSRLGKRDRHCPRVIIGTFFAVAVWLVAGSCSGPPVSDSTVPESAEPSPSDPALQIAAQVMEALGGQQAWDRTRHIRFTFFGRRTHHWDKHSGDHRLEATEDGKHYVVLHNLKTRVGHAFMDGRELTGQQAEEWLDRAYSSWVNDTYWLLMPYKLRDPGVLLSYEGTETIDDTAYEVLHLQFEQVGLTPGDEYWAYIHPETRLMDRWAYRLESMEPDATPTAWRWEGWRPVGEIMLAPLRIRVEDGREAELSDLGVFDELPETVYGSPDPVS